jgi:hypothetical protein
LARQRPIVSAFLINDPGEIEIERKGRSPHNGRFLVLRDYQQKLWRADDLNRWKLLLY